MAKSACEHGGCIQVVHSNVLRHGKVAVIDDTAVIGSHNFSDLGVWMGTKELSVYLRDVELADQVRAEVVRGVDLLAFD